MKLALIVAIVLVISSLRRGVDSFQNVLCLVLGFESPGTILEAPIKMAGGLIDTFWQVIVQVFEHPPETNAGVMRHGIALMHIGNAAATLGGWS